MGREAGRDSRGRKGREKRHARERRYVKEEEEQ